MPDYVAYLGGPKNGQGFNEFILDLRKSQKDLQSQVRSVAREAVQDIVHEARAGFRGGTKQQPSVANSIQAEFFKGKPAVRAGGSKVAISGRGRKRPVLAGEIIVGAEFGGYRKNTPNKTGAKPWTGSARQFPARTARFGRGNEGYFLWPAIRKHYKKVLEDFDKALTGIFNKFGH